MTAAHRLLLAGAVALGACGGSSTPSVRGSPPGRWPAVASTFDAATGVGCLPRSMLQVCEVPDGSVLGADGLVHTPAGTSVRCASACPFTSYMLECHGSAGAPVPGPASSLGCEVLPVPTPLGLSFWCCPPLP